MFISLHSDTALNCTEGEIRLVGGNSPYEGQVEMCVLGYWGKVCPPFWSPGDAAAVCNELGYSENGMWLAGYI